MKIIYIGNGCESYSNTITIPAKSELTSTMDIPERTTFFLTFNDQYQYISSYSIWAYITYDKLTQKEIDEFGIKPLEFPPMTLKHLRYRIKRIDDKYPRSMSPNILLVILMISLLMGLAMVGYFLYRIYKMRSHLRSLKDLKHFFNGTADNEHLNELRTQFKKLLSPVDLQRFLPRGGPSPARGAPVTTPRTQGEQSPTPPIRPSTSHEIIPLQELPPTNHWSMLLAN